MAITTLDEMFIHELSDIYSAEKQLSRAAEACQSRGEP